MEKDHANILDTPLRTIMNEIFTASRRRFIFGLISVLLLFLFLQYTLHILAPSSKRKDNIVWWTALSTLTVEEGIFNVWTPYPPIFPLMHYGSLRAITTPVERDLLITHFFDENERPESAETTMTILTRMESLWSLMNAVVLFSISVLVFLLTRAMFPLPRAILAALGFLLFHLTWNGRILLGISMDQFDFLPVFFLLVGAYFLLQKRHVPIGIAIGIGTMLKIFPFILLPITLFTVRTVHARLMVIAVVALTIGFIAMPFMVKNPAIFLATYQWTAARPGWESVWSYDPQHPFRHPFPPMPDAEEMRNLFLYPYHDARITLRSGEVLRGEVVSENGTMVVFVPQKDDAIRIPRSTIKNLRRNEPRRLHDFLLPLFTIALLIGLPLIFRAKLTTPSGVLRCLLLSVLILLLLSKGVSAYFFLWFTPFLFVLYHPAIAGMIFGTLLLIGNAEYITMASGFSWFWPSILMREMIFAILGVHQLWMLHK